MYNEERISRPEAMSPAEAEMENITEAIELFIEGARTESATIALISQAVGRYEATIPPEDHAPEGAALYGFIDPQDDDRMYTSYDLAYLEDLRPDAQLFVKRANGVWVEHEVEEGVELYGLIDVDGGHLHGSRSLVWIEDLQLQFPRSTITVKRDGRWSDYAKARSAE